MNQKFLLILDDVWTDDDTEWDALLKPLRCGMHGSKIIATTRDDSTARVIGTVPAYYLKELSDDNCWSLFAERAFGNMNLITMHPKLEELGRKIVKKSNGLPLAAKTMGGLLRSKRDPEEWEKVLNSNLWDLPNDKILPALRLSYHHLASPLKRCFAYCAIFRKGYEFQKEELVFLWMAEGFLIQPEGTEDMEDVGNQYFDDLMSKSFFQRSNTHASCYIMHDLFIDLAKYISGEFCFRFEEDNSHKNVERTRHLSFTRAENDTTSAEKLQAIGEAKLLRTFLPVRWEWHLKPYCLNNEALSHLSLNNVEDEATPNLLLALKRLRVISLAQYGLTELPTSIDYLKHLRYLDLLGTSIRRLPESICSLSNLQTLILCGCKDLVELPSNMAKLINLRYLDLRVTKIQEMLSHIGRLMKLCKLTDFVIGKQSGSSISELGALCHLKGSLCIWNLQNITHAQHAMAANMKNKHRLKNLELRWEGDTDNSLHERDVLEQLRPHANMEFLSLSGFGGTRFPDWVGNFTFSNLASLELDGCKYCASLPTLGQLPSLKKLSITSFDGIFVVGPEFYTANSPITAMQPFQCLEVLKFKRMLQWQTWTPYAADECGAFPLLQKLCIRECPNLTNALPSHLPSLAKLEIEDCQQLVVSLPSAPNLDALSIVDESRDVELDRISSFGLFCFKSGRFNSYDTEPLDCFATKLQEIEIRDRPSLDSFSLELFPVLKTLFISDCPDFKSLSALDNSDLKYLSSLEICSCASFVSFPIGGLHASNLTQLSLWDCSQLQFLPEHMKILLPSLVTLELANCPELECFPEEGLPCKLESVFLKNCNKLIAGRVRWNLQILPSLSEFKIWTNAHIEFFPDDTLLPGSLTSLQIWELPNLKSLNYEGLRQLTSLTELNIYECTQFQSFPEEGLPSSITSLSIQSCPELEALSKVLPSELESLKIAGCDKLVANCMQWDLHSFTSLSHFEIQMCENMVCFPEDSLLPSTLTSLEIHFLENLESLNYKGLQHLTSLREMIIQNCPKLISLPVEGLPSSLSALSICNCPFLEERCELDGEDWHKICHIQSIRIGFRTIS